MGASPIASPLLAVQDLGVRVRDRWILNSLNFAVPQGELTALLGGNGQGKSTLFKILAGFRQPERGWVTLLGEPYPNDPVHAGVAGVVLENLTEQFVTGTVGDEVEMAIACAYGRSTLPWEPLLESLGLSLPEDQPPQTLSGGEQARLLVALAVLKQPQVLILDDPFVFLGWPEIRVLLQCLQDLVENGVVGGCVFSTTETEIAVYADSVAVLQDGDVVFQGPPGDLGGSTLPPGVQRPLGQRCAEVWGEGFEVPGILP